jgi:phosphoribosylaminoimidazole-succinocarboxamide synthase
VGCDEEHDHEGCGDGGGGAELGRYGLGVELVHSGKVRDVYADGEDLILVATDRVSVYDVVLPTPIPDKGRVLTALSLWWFEQLADLVPNHVRSATDVPAEFVGRAIRVQKLQMLPVECIARGYLTGSGLAEYRKGGAICGVALPAGLEDGSRLTEPIFTPTTKAPLGTHDEFIEFSQVVAEVGEGLAEQIRDLTIAVYERGAAIAAGRGLVMADTKLEFGRSLDGVLTLGDEVLTPDSSRFWPLDSWKPGGPNFSFDKQYVRDWASSTGWDKRPPAPSVPADVVEVTRQRYFDAYQRLTGEAFPA